MSEKGQIYSYHTFLYPFVWDNGGRTEREDFEQNLRGDWVEDNMITKDNQLSSVVAPQPWIDEQQNRLDYQTFQYFNSAARKALFRSDGSIVHGWLYRPAEIHNKGKYIIEAKGKKYELNINHIKLQLFNTGVGILRFELEYSFPEGGIEQARRDIRAINEYGRRIYPEFLPSEIDGTKDNSFLKSNLCASVITLDFGNGTVFCEQIESRANAHIHIDSGKIKSIERSYLNSPMQNDSFVTRLLLNKNDSLKIIPAVDDRMFVCCCIDDPDYVNHFLGYPAWPSGAYSMRRQRADWQFKTDWETGKELYALINIDAGDSSCQNRRMLDQYFEEQLYLRWLEYGTIHAVTNHSMLCMTSRAVQGSVIYPFLIEYIPMCELVLAQRASLIAFDARITDAIASSSNREGMKKEELEQLIELQKKFTIFQGELLLAEVTPQIQGIELYEKLQEMLFIQKLHDNIQDQMKNLFELAEVEQASRQGTVEKAFMLIALLSVGSAWQDLYDFFGNIFPDNKINVSFMNMTIPLLWLIICFGVIVLVVFFFHKVIKDVIKEKYRDSRRRRHERGK